MEQNPSFSISVTQSQHAVGFNKTITVFFGGACENDNLTVFLGEAFILGGQFSEAGGLRKTVGEALDTELNVNNSIAPRSAPLEWEVLAGGGALWVLYEGCTLVCTT